VPLFSARFVGFAAARNRLQSPQRSIRMSLLK
jgi:hypothetical protein